MHAIVKGVKSHLILFDYMFNMHRNGLYLSLTLTQRLKNGTIFGGKARTVRRGHGCFHVGALVNVSIDGHDAGANPHFARVSLNRHVSCLHGKAVQVNDVAEAQTEDSDQFKFRVNAAIRLLGLLHDGCSRFKLLVGD